MSRFSRVAGNVSCCIGLMATGLLLLPPGASNAASRRTIDRDAETREKTVVKPNPGPVLAVVSLASQRITVYGSDGVLAHSAVSTGMAGHRTPTGVFSVLSKNRWHQSNIYSGAPMPYMQRITWSGVALHAGVVPGYPASHGCIRLPEHFAVELWGITKVGARVVVSPTDTSAMEFSSARMPLPTFAPDEENPAGQAKPELVSVAMNGSASEGAETSISGQRLLNPLERAKAAKIRTAADAQARAKDAKAAVELSAAKAAQANKAIAALRVTDAAVATARAKLDAATAALDVVKTDEAAERAKAVVAAAEAKLAEATKAADEAQAAEAAATPEALSAARIAWDAENASRTATAAAKAAEHGADPISIFISKKTGKLYIRQNWIPIHESAVAIREAELPIGTHTYLAVEPAADGKNLRWLSVSFPAARPAHDDDEDDDDRPRSRRGKPAKDAETSPRHPQPTAAEALERVDIPEETRQFISERLWTGAALTISDQGISDETGTYTDFVVLTR